MNGFLLIIKIRGKIDWRDKYGDMIYLRCCNINYEFKII